ncbi:hypothetical protein ACFX12_009067 [Malus domestica]
MAELGFPLAAILIEKPRLRCFRGDLLGVGGGLKRIAKAWVHHVRHQRLLFYDEEKQAHNKELRSWLRQLQDVLRCA